MSLVLGGDGPVGLGVLELLRRTALSVAFVLAGWMFVRGVCWCVEALRGWRP